VARFGPFCGDVWYPFSGENWYTLSYHLQQSGHFEYDENLEGFYDYRSYGEQHIRQEGGQFNECGYVAYRGVMPLEEFMQTGSAEQRQQGPQMGGFS
jgi:hypothetical protein